MTASAAVDVAAKAEDGEEDCPGLSPHPAVPRPNRTRVRSPTKVLDARVKLRARARRLGVLAEGCVPSTPQVTGVDRERALGTTEGIGPILDRLWAEGR
ncbi:MAG: hypothetical protein IRZ07_29800 [Microbispora sp.]|nr:hypothetical protein [Microbispora sp.]